MRHFAWVLCAAVLVSGCPNPKPIPTAPVDAAPEPSAPNTSFLEVPPAGKMRTTEIKIGQDVFAQVFSYARDCDVPGAIARSDEHWVVLHPTLAHLRGQNAVSITPKDEINCAKPGCLDTALAAMDGLESQATLYSFRTVAHFDDAKAVNLPATGSFGLEYKAASAGGGATVLGFNPVTTPGGDHLFEAVIATTTGADWDDSPVDFTAGEPYPSIKPGDWLAKTKEDSVAVYQAAFSVDIPSFSTIRSWADQLNPRWPNQEEQIKVGPYGRDGVFQVGTGARTNVAELRQITHAEKLIAGGCGASQEFRVAVPGQTTILTGRTALQAALTVDKTCPWTKAKSCAAAKFAKLPSQGEFVHSVLHHYDAPKELGWLAETHDVRAASVKDDAGKDVGVILKFKRNGVHWTLWSGSIGLDARKVTTGSYAAPVQVPINSLTRAGEPVLLEVETTSANKPAAQPAGPSYSCPK